uniref:Dehydrogenase/reductase 2 n=1 Tax=Panthera leo TaxID=9689 RepID=A0A8C8XP58_PANLE
MSCSLHFCHRIGFHCGGLDFLVCSAGVNPLVGSTLGASEQVWDKLGPYNISKTALLSLTRTLSLELAPKGIRVNCLVPGITKCRGKLGLELW